MFQTPEYEQAQTPEAYVGRAHEVRDARMYLESVVDEAGLESTEVLGTVDPAIDHVAAIDAMTRQINSDRGHDNV